MKQCASDAPGAPTSKSAPPPIRPTVIHNLLNWYARPFDRPSITEIVIVTLSSDGTSGNLVEPWPFRSRSYLPLTDGDRAKRESRCLPRGSLGNSVRSSESNLHMPDDPLGISRRSLKGSPPF